MTPSRPGSGLGTALDAACILGLLACAAAILALTTGGYADADDRYYLKAADAWRTHAPAIGTLHWDMRLPLVLAMAAATALGGRTELAAFIVPAVLCVLILLLATYALVRPAAGRAAAVLAGLLAISAPVVAIYGRDFGPDILEAALCAASLALFVRGWRRPDPRATSAAWLGGAGLVLGVCFVDRATCVPLLGVYGLVFAHAMWNRHPGRWHMLALFSAFAVPLLAEAIYYTFMTGTPFYRWGIDARSLEIPSNHMIGQVAGGLRPPFSAALMARWRPNSFIDVHWTVNPFIDMVTNPQHGWLILPGAAAGIALWRRTEPGSPLGWLVRVLCLWAALILIVVLVVLNLRPQPRYFLTLTWIAAALAALWLAPFLRRPPVALATAALLALNPAASRARPDPIAADRLIVQHMREEGGAVWSTDAHRDTLLLLDASLAPRLRPLPAPPGAPTFLTAPEAAQAPYQTWSVLWQAAPTPPWPLGLVQRATGLRLPHGSTAMLVAAPP